MSDTIDRLAVASGLISQINCATFRARKGITSLVLERDLRVYNFNNVSYAALAAELANIKRYVAEIEAMNLSQES